MRGAVAAVVLALLVFAMQQVLLAFGISLWLVVPFSWLSCWYAGLIASDVQRRSW